MSESAIQSAPTPWETELLTGFDQFCATRQVAARLAHAPRFPPEISTSARLIRRLVDVPFGRPRLRGLLVRCAAFAAGLGMTVLLVYLAVSHEGWAACLAVIFGTLWYICFYAFAQNEYHNLFRTYGLLRAARAETYRRAEQYAALAPEQAAPRLDDPVVRKYTADVLAAGFVHVGDVSPVPFEEADGTYRIFRAPTRGTYLVLNCWARTRSGDETYPYWPMLVDFECQTFFSDGGRVDSLNQRTHDSNISDRPASTRLLTFPKVADPLALYQAHMEAVETVLDETTAMTVRHEPLDLYIRRQEQISEEEHRASARRGYSWRDHIRWYFQLDAKSSDNSK
ncbi:MAG: hypothetical protein J0I06_09350 [Planctomycetes bacterium]|nr:hypothetical protein [Planctomycetota bacterium]